MSDYNVTTSPIFGEIEYFESHEDLSEYLEEIKPTLANIIIEFNSLEDEISTFLCEMANDAEHDKIYVFLADMMFRKKSDALVKMYYLESQKNSYNYDEEIGELAKVLSKCGESRNQYAHGSWLHASPVKGISVKVKSSKKGTERIYRKFTTQEMNKDLNLITSTRAHVAHFHKRICKSYVADNKRLHEDTLPVGSANE